jgi:DNA-binding Xre family transcriptional regulator
MLSFNLNPIFVARQITKPYSFLVKIGIAPNTATRIINNQVRIMRLDHIELLCQHLHCEPNDLLAYKPNNLIKLSENHPLNKLITKEDDTQWQETLRTMSLSQLKEITKIITQSQSNDKLNH